MISKRGNRFSEKHALVSDPVDHAQNKTITKEPRPGRISSCAKSKHSEDPSIEDDERGGNDERPGDMAR